MTHAKNTELLLTVPAELTAKSVGLSIDMGGSVLKFVYRTKEDYEQAASGNAKNGRLRLVSFPRKDIEEGLEYVRQRAYLLRTEDASKQPMVCATGLGCTENGKLICDKLSVRLQNITEFDCFAKSFHYLAAHLPRQSLLEPFAVDMINEPMEFFISQLEMVAQAQGGSLYDSDMKSQIKLQTGRSPADELERPVSEPVSEAESDLYPCVLVMAGSGIGFLKIEKDGSFQLLDASNRGGKSFIGLGTMITGCQTFDELIDLASKGNVHNIHQYSDEVFVSDATEANFYSNVSERAKGVLTYCFGKVADGRDQINREDVAAAWLEYIVMDLVQLTHLVCAVNDVGRVFFSGGFTGHQLVRRIATRELALRNMFAATFTNDNQGGQAVVFDFIKPGEHLGALGSLINSLENSLLNSLNTAAAAN